MKLNVARQNSENKTEKELSPAIFVNATSLGKYVYDVRLKYYIYEKYWNYTSVRSNV